MDKVIEWIKRHVKEGVDIEEVKPLIEKVNPVNELKTVDEALAFIEKTGILVRAFDTEVSRKVETGVKNWQEKNLDKLVSDARKEEAEKVRKELAPDETPEQKQIREQGERIAAFEKREKILAQKQALREKAKEIAEKAGVKYDPIRAEMFAEFGDNAEKMLQGDVEFIKATVEQELSTKLKGHYNTDTPAGRGTVITPVETLENEYKKAVESGNGKQAFFIKEQIRQQQQKKE